MHIAVLWTFAFAKPLFDVLADSPDFFIARGNTGADIVLFAVGVTLVPPTAFVAAARGTGPGIRDRSPQWTGVCGGAGNRGPPRGPSPEHRIALALRYRRAAAKSLTAAARSNNHSAREAPTFAPEEPGHCHPIPLDRVTERLAVTLPAGAEPVTDRRKHIDRRCEAVRHPPAVHTGGLDEQRHTPNLREVVAGDEPARHARPECHAVVGDQDDQRTVPNPFRSSEARSSPTSRSTNWTWSR